MQRKISGDKKIKREAETAILCSAKKTPTRRLLKISFWWIINVSKKRCSRSTNPHCTIVRDDKISWTQKDLNFYFLCNDLNSRQCKRNIKASAYVYGVLVMVNLMQLPKKQTRRERNIETHCQMRRIKGRSANATYASWMKRSSKSQL